MGRRHRSRIALWVLGGILLLLVAARVLAPVLLEDRINAAIAESPDYRGSVADVDLQLIKGGFQLEGIHIEATDPKADFARLDAKALHVSLSWPALLDGVVASEIDLYAPHAVITRSRVEKAPQKKPRPLADRLEELTPFDLDRFQIHGGALDFVDVEERDTVVVGADRLDLTVRNLTNRAQAEGDRFAEAEATARIAESGDFSATVRFAPLSEMPLFDLDAAVKDLDLTQLNDAFRGYLGMDVEKGRADLFVEAASEDGRFEGYVKPVVDDLEVFSLKEKHKNVGQFLKEAVTDLAAEVFENQEKDQLATRVRIEGRIQNPEAGVFDAIVGILQNAFVRALLPRFDRSIDLGDVARGKGDDEKK